MAMACARASKQIFTMVLRSVINSTFSFFQTTPTGRIVNRLGMSDILIFYDEDELVGNFNFLKNRSF